MVEKIVTFARCDKARSTKGLSRPNMKIPMPLNDWHEAIARVRHIGASGHAPFLKSILPHLVAQANGSTDRLLEIAETFAAAGLMGEAEQCNQLIIAQHPEDPSALINLANIARETLDHDRARQIIERLMTRFPDDPVLGRIAVLGLEYDPRASPEERLAAARRCGAGLIRRAGGWQPRPMRKRDGARIRVGYLSADLCTHPVGRLLLQVLQAHDGENFEVYAYSSGSADDTLTEEIGRVAQLRNIRKLNDKALCEQIKADGIEVLVDLGGYTAGSRLGALSWRPAPVQLTWLGHAGSTGMGSVIDGVLMDRDHLQPGEEIWFDEPVLMLPSRLCVQPPDALPEPGPAPHSIHGHITFGSLNNTSKVNEEVFNTWANVMHAVPGSRIIMKWRTFHDDAFCRTIVRTFASRGIEEARLDLRGSGAHREALATYQEIDIALDTWPFSGGMTSLEALWMGVPVVTMLRDRAISRQTASLLKQIGLGALVAHERAGFAEIATRLAYQPGLIAKLRGTLRDRLRHSKSGSSLAVARALEGHYRALIANLKAGSKC